jgi:hypothetical protein
MATARQRWTAIAGGLLVTVWLAFGGSEQAPDSSAVSEARRAPAIRVPSAGAPAGAPRPAAVTGGRAWPTNTGGDLFPPQSWRPPVAARTTPPLPVQENLPPPPPPPPPYAYFGRFDDGSGQPTAYLKSGERVLQARAGMILDGSYRVDTINPNRVELTYLPLELRQSIGIGGAP